MHDITVVRSPCSFQAGFGFNTTQPGDGTECSMVEFLHITVMHERLARLVYTGGFALLVHGLTVKLAQACQGG